MRATSTRARLVTAALVATVSLAVAGCEGSDKPTPSASGVLKASDLPSKPVSSASANVAPQLSRYCAFQYAGIFGPGFDIDGVEFRDVDGATVVSTVSRLPGTNLTDDRISDIRDEFSRCPAATEPGPDGERLKEIPVGDGRFGYESYAKDGSLEGRVGFAYAKQAYVTVTTTFADGADTSLDLEALLAQAVTRADAVSKD